MGNIEKKIDVRAFIDNSVEKVVNSQHGIAFQNIERLRRLHPEKNPQELENYIRGQYLGVISALGAVAGAAAVIPNGAIQIPAALLDLGTFMEASALYAFSVAVIHNLDIEDYERRRWLVMSVLAGEAAAKKVVQQQVVQRLAGHWGAQVLKNFPRAAIVTINKVLGPRFVTLTGSKVGVLVLGKQVPFMIGSAIGATGNVVFGLFVIKSADKILGPLPEAWEDAKPAKKTSAAKPRKAVTAKKTAATKAPAKKANSSKSPAKKAN